MKIIPLGERVVIKPLEATEERTKSGIYLPKASEDRKQGQIVETGFFRDGKPLPVNKGDKVIYGGFNSEEFEINGQKHLIIEFKDILAKIED